MDPVDVTSPLRATVIALRVEVGQEVGAGQVVAILESMKMEHEVRALGGGRVVSVGADPGQQVEPGQALVAVDPSPTGVEPEGSTGDAAGTTSGPAGHRSGERADIAEVIERHQIGLDASRPDAVASRDRKGRRTARANIADLVDEGSFVEYAPLVVAAQRRRRELDDLIRNTPADGLIGGVAEVNGDLVGPEAAKAVVMAYDYTVLAGTQGMQNHRKKDRMFDLAAEMGLPVVFFTEGGGGRPGDTDALGIAGLDCEAFARFAALSQDVALVGVNSGYCFAGNAALLGMCDVVIATEDSNIAMAGPAMVEGGGLGAVHPRDLGPAEVQVANGVIDCLARDEAHAVELARHALAMFQGSIPSGAVPDQSALGELVPENRVRVYDMHLVIEGLCDEGSILELSPGWAPGMITALARIEGRAVGICANNPVHLGGAIDPLCATKSARFLGLCESRGLPLLFLCDTPGFMVGPETEEAGMVSAAAELFRVGAKLSVPHATVITRKGYGLGAQAMAGGRFKAGRFTVAWPTGEIGGMGLEGAVKLGFRRELEAVEDPGERQALFDSMVDLAYEHGKALSAASHFEIDDVIDPADTRRWISAVLLD